MYSQLNVCLFSNYKNKLFHCLFHKSFNNIQINKWISSNKINFKAKVNKHYEMCTRHAKLNILSCKIRCHYVQITNTHHLQRDW